MALIGIATVLIYKDEFKPKEKSETESSKELEEIRSVLREIRAEVKEAQNTAAESKEKLSTLTLANNFKKVRLGE